MFVFPMSGRAQRFLEAGYDVEKYLLKVEGFTIFERAVMSFQEYFHSDKFVFIMRDDDKNKNLVRQLIVAMDITSFSIVEISHSYGQADTVRQGIFILELNNCGKNLQDEEIYIFNIDSFLMCFKKFSMNENVKASLDVFRPVGEHFSFVTPHTCLPNTVHSVTEKIKVSDLASTGLYYFKYVKDFLECIDIAGESVIDQYGELYVAPLLNYLVQRDELVTYREIENDEIVILGTPLEYEDYVG